MDVRVDVRVDVGPARAARRAPMVRDRPGGRPGEARVSGGRVTGRPRRVSGRRVTGPPAGVRPVTVTIRVAGPGDFDAVGALSVAAYRRGGHFDDDGAAYARQLADAAGRARDAE